MFIIFLLVGGTKDYKILMDKFQLVQTSFLELNKEWALLVTMNLCSFPT